MRGKYKVKYEEVAGWVVWVLTAGNRGELGRVYSLEEETAEYGSVDMISYSYMGYNVICTSRMSEKIGLVHSRELLSPLDHTSLLACSRDYPTLAKLSYGDISHSEVEE